DVVELDPVQRSRRYRMHGARLFLHLQDVPEIVQRNLALSIDVDDVAKFLQRAEDKERIEPQRQVLPEINPVDIDQVHQQAENPRTERIDRRSLNEAEAPDKFHLRQFEAKNPFCRTVQTTNLLVRQAKALHEFNVAQRF